MYRGPVLIDLSCALILLDPLCVQIKYIFPAQFAPLYAHEFQASLITSHTHVTSCERIRISTFQQCHLIQAVLVQKGVDMFVHA